MVLHNALGDALRFPAAIPERLGLALVKRLEADPRFARETIAGLADTATPGAEAAALALAVAPPKVPAPAADEIIAGVRLSGRAGSLRLSGSGVDAAFRARLEAWIKEG